MFKVVRRITALVTLIAVALKGVLTFLSWVEKQDEIDAVWADDEDLEEAF